MSIHIKFDVCTSGLISLEISLSIISHQDVTHLPDVNSSGFLALGVSVSQFCHRRDWVQSGVLRQGERDDLQGLRVRTETVLLHSCTEK